MLSENEKRKLRGIEQQLEREAPQFVDELRNGGARLSLLDREWPYTSIVLLGVALFMLGWLVGSIVLFLMGVAAGTFALVARIRQRRRMGRRGGDK
ncbi:DUF3040 domain-containing protein [Kibdelosporangium aridum]|uniref:DUF3040 domain-containing protein n=1 Tax=Kibdelosporangium aridum TaxID=2030 RepID=A0A428ZB34_KIBAR|nr:DUF3040 domain-containing protein [Kibdelosporangium aridum]RSM85241.1 DUF3040 domain-containing protein [Kibdelosporangium aridum]